MTPVVVDDVVVITTRRDAGSSQKTQRHVSLLFIVDLFIVDHRLSYSPCEGWFVNDRCGWNRGS